MNGMFPPHSKDVTPHLQNRCASSSIYTRRERDQFLDRFFLPRRINFQHPVNLMPRSPPHRRGHALHSSLSRRALPGLLHAQAGRAPPRPLFSRATFGFKRRPTDRRSLFGDELPPPEQGYHPPTR